MIINRNQVIDIQTLSSSYVDTRKQPSYVDYNEPTFRITYRNEIRFIEKHKEFPKIVASYSGYREDTIETDEFMEYEDDLEVNNYKTIFQGKEVILGSHEYHPIQFGNVCRMLKELENDGFTEEYVRAAIPNLDKFFEI